MHNHVASTDLTVLIIEDDEAARSVMERTLADAGYSVPVAGDGAEGMDVVR